MGKADVLACATAAYYNPLAGKSQAERDSLADEADTAASDLRSEIDAQLDAAYKRGRDSVKGSACPPPAPLILAMTDWRADPTPYPLRADTGPRAVWPQGVA